MIQKIRHIRISGGVPKNTSFNKQVLLLDQILKKKMTEGKITLIQITLMQDLTQRSFWSNITRREKLCKVQDAHQDVITVYADATIAFPIFSTVCNRTTIITKNKKTKKNCLKN